MNHTAQTGHTHCGGLHFSEWINTLWWTLLLRILKHTLMEHIVVIVCRHCSGPHWPCCIHILLWTTVFRLYTPTGGPRFLSFIHALWCTILLTLWLWTVLNPMFKLYTDCGEQHYLHCTHIPWSYFTSENDSPNNSNKTWRYNMENWNIIKLLDEYCHFIDPPRKGR